MFGDASWDPSRMFRQETRFERWVAEARSEGRRRYETEGAECSPAVCIVEIGSGKAVPTVRMTSESVASQTRGSLVRINPREADIPSRIPRSRAVEVYAGGLEAIRQIDAAMKELTST